MPLSKVMATITREITSSALSMMQIDELGLDDLDRRILSVIARDFDGGPVGARDV